MPNQLPYGFMSNQSMPNYPNMESPFYNINNQNNDYVIMELEKRINNLEQRVKKLENSQQKQSYDYQTSMNMM